MIATSAASFMEGYTGHTDPGALQQTQQPHNRCWESGKTQRKKNRGVAYYWKRPKN